MNTCLRTKLMMLTAVYGCVLCGVVGCQSTSSKLAGMNPFTGIGKSEAPFGAPEQVVASWTEAVLHESGKGTRGFGGRLYFYERGSADPIRVSGQLVVYAFAEDGRAAADNRPTKRYVFPPEQFAKHESDSEIGVSYSVWLPWDAAGGEQAAVSLIARFEPTQGGGLVVSDQTRLRLPGRSRHETAIAVKAKQSAIQQTSAAESQETVTPAIYEQSSQQSKPKMTATTISLPGKFKNARKGSSPPSQFEPSAQPIKAVPTQSLTDFEPTPFGTKIEYLTPGESVRRSLRQSSYDSSR